MTKLKLDRATRLYHLEERTWESHGRFGYRKKDWWVSFRNKEMDAAGKTWRHFMWGMDIPLTVGYGD